MRALDQQILGAAPDALHALAGDEGVQIRRHRPAQLTLAHLGAAQRGALQVRGDAAARGFDFRQFRHGVLRSGGLGAAGARTVGVDGSQSRAARSQHWAGWGIVKSAWYA